MNLKLQLVNSKPFAISGNFITMLMDRPNGAGNGMYLKLCKNAGKVSPLGILDFKRRQTSSQFECETCGEHRRSTAAD